MVTSSTRSKWMQKVPRPSRQLTNLSIQGEYTLGVDKKEFCASYPFLYHMAWDGSWPTISEDGLLSTSALLDLYEIAGSQRHAIESAYRSQTVVLRHPTRKPVLIRDQHPLSEKALARCLQDGMQPSEWYRILNARVYFWLTKDRLGRMLSSPAYAKIPHLVLTLRTEVIVDRYWEQVRLAAMNTGCTVPFAHPRGASTFYRPEDYPWQERKNRGGDRVVEFTVLGGITDVESALESVERRVPHGDHQESFAL